MYSEYEHNSYLATIPTTPTTMSNKQQEYNFMANTISSSSCNN